VASLQEKLAFGENLPKVVKPTRKLAKKWLVGRKYLIN